VLYYIDVFTIKHGSELGDFYGKNGKSLKLDRQHSLYLTVPFHSISCLGGTTIELPTLA
jgi:hypothetical protein